MKRYYIKTSNEKVICIHAINIIEAINQANMKLILGEEITTIIKYNDLKELNKEKVTIKT